MGVKENILSTFYTAVHMTRARRAVKPYGKSSMFIWTLQKRSILDQNLPAYERLRVRGVYFLLRSACRHTYMYIDQSRPTNSQSLLNTRAPGFSKSTNHVVTFLRESVSQYKSSSTEKKIDLSGFAYMCWEKKGSFWEFY